jgi:hypothetical protein
MFLLLLNLRTQLVELPNVFFGNARVASTVQPRPDLGEYIDIDIPESSDEEGSLHPGPPADPPAPGPTPQPGSTGQPASSQGGDGRTNVAHYINHFYRRGNKNILGSKTVCIYCEWVAFQCFNSVFGLTVIFQNKAQG